jgi:hypothetical protein
LAVLQASAGSARATEDSCSPVDLRQPGGSMEGTRPMAQGDHGICYAYASAQLADAWARGHLPRPRTQQALDGLPRTSPIMLAIDDKMANPGKGSVSTCHAPDATCKPQDPIDGGGIADCINYLRDHPNSSCDHAKTFGIPSLTYTVTTWEDRGEKSIFNDPEPTAVHKDVTLTGLGIGGDFDQGQQALGANRHVEKHFAGRDSDFLTQVESAWDEYQQRLSDPLNAHRDVAGDMSKQLYCTLSNASVPLDLIPGQLVGNTDSVIKSMFTDLTQHQGTKINFLNRFFGTACSGKKFAITPTLPKIESVDFSAINHKHNDAQITDLINRQLTQGGMPAAIDYCASVLEGHFGGLASQPTQVRDSTGHLSDTDCLGLPKSSGRPGEDEAHASLVIGRKRAPSGSCMYLVRNSWGVGCERFIDSPGIQCEEGTGDLWIDQAKLASSVFGVEHYK